MTKEEIALQLTLKSIDRMHTDFRYKKQEENNNDFSKQVCDFYNYIYNNLDCYKKTDNFDFATETISDPDVI